MVKKMNNNIRPKRPTMFLVTLTIDYLAALIAVYALTKLPFSLGVIAGLVIIGLFLVLVPLIFIVSNKHK